MFVLFKDVIKLLGTQLEDFQNCLVIHALLENTHKSMILRHYKFNKINHVMIKILSVVRYEYEISLFTTVN